jgi:cation diffusion facilitator family transporter
MSGDRPRQLKRYAWLSIATAILTIGLKYVAYRLTGSVGLLSDALESGVNLVAALMALWALTVATRPPDEEHAYGHDKAEYFSSGVEGTLILLAAFIIAVTALQDLLAPPPLERLTIGLAISVVAALANGVTGGLLLRAGRHYRSTALEADARHLFTDVWTTAGVVLGLGVVTLTGWRYVDPVIALLVAANILYHGLKLVREAIDGLMDRALPEAEVVQIEKILAGHVAMHADAAFHALRTRRSGMQRFMSVHVQVPGAWSVQEGHTFVEEIERDVREVLAPIAILVHLEPVEDPASWQDIDLNRGMERAGESQPLRSPADR